MPVTLICRYAPCRKEFSVKPYKAEIAQYCSPKCYRLGQAAQQLATFWDKVQICSHGFDCIYCCWPFQGETTNIYRHTYINNKAIDAHRIAWQLGNNRQIPDGLHVAHYCHFRACTNWDHLHLATRVENYADSIRDHRIKSGEQHHNSKLTKATALEAFDLKVKGWSNKRIAAHLLVNPSTIDHLIRGLIWKDLPRPEGMIQIGPWGWPK